MMYELDKYGRIAGNMFTDYSSYETIQKSLLLPMPSTKQIVTARSGNALDIIESKNGLIAELIPILENYIKITPEITLEDIDANILALSSEDRLDLYRDLLNYVNSHDLTLLHEDDVNPEKSIIPKFIRDINHYNNVPLSLASKKNYVMAAVYEAASDLNNLEEAEMPMDFKDIQDSINSKTRKNTSALNDLNPFTIWSVQRENAVGKLDVGISANALKATGAMLQYYNRRYAEGLLNPDDKINISLSFAIKTDNGEKSICKEHFFRIANTKMSEEIFVREFKSIFGENYSLHPKYNLFKAWATKQLNSFGELTQSQKDFVDTLNSLEEREKITRDINGTNFINALYQSIDYELNAADQISKFISLSTDNAKTLALAKMNGRPELLSMPLTMLALGVHIDDVIDICCNLLEVISNDLDSSRFSEKFRTNDVRKIIEKHKADFTSDTYNSLLKIYDIAQEMRTLTSFFAVNQGVEVRYVDLLVFLKNLSLQKIDAAERKLRTISVDSITKNRLLKPFNFTTLFSDNDEITLDLLDIISDYGQVKSGFNVMQIIFGSPHFRAQLLSIVEITNIIEDISGKAEITSKFLRIESDDFASEDAAKDEQSKEKTTKSQEIKIANRIVKLIDSYCIEEALKKISTSYQFKVGDLSLKFGNKWSDLADTTVISLDTATSVNQFLSFIEDAVVPYILENYPYNYFFNNLTWKEDWITGRKFLDLPFDSFAAREDLSIANDINKAAIEFEDVAQLPIGVKTVLGNSVTLGDLMYLYYVVTTRNQIKGSMTCVYKGAKKYNPELVLIVDDEYYNLDRLSQLAASGNLAALQELTRITTTLLPYVKALENKGEAIVGNLKYTTDKEFISTMDKGSVVNRISLLQSNDDAIANTIQSLLLEKINNYLGLDSNSDLAKITVSIESHTPIGLTLRVGITLTGALQQSTYTMNYIVRESAEQHYIDAEDIDSLLNKVLENVHSVNVLMSKMLDSGSLKRNVSLLEAGPENMQSVIAEISDNMKGDIIGQNIVDFLEKSNSLVISVAEESNVLSHIEYINSTPVVVINPILFRVADNTALNILIEMYLQSLTPNVLSQTEELIKFLLIFDNTISRDNYMDRLFDPSDSIHEKLKESFVANQFVNYILDADKTEYLKRQCRIKLAQYSNALLNLNIYYRTVRENEQIDKAKPGDIYINTKDQSEWVCLLRDLDNKLVYVRIEKLNDLSKPVVDVLFRINDKFKRYKTLRLSEDFKVGQLNLTDIKNIYSYNSKPEQISFNSIRTGDKIIKNGSEYFVLDVIYEPSIEGILKYLVIQKMDGVSGLTLLKYDSKSFTVLKPDKYITDVQNNSNDIKLDLSACSLSLKRKLLSKLRKGNIINIGDLSVKLKSKITSDLYVTSEDSSININDITSVQIPYIDDLDSEFGIKSRDKILRISLSEWESSEWKTYPEFLDGYTTEWDKNKNHVKIIAGRLILKGNNKVKIPNFNLGDYTNTGSIVDFNSVKEGDFLTKFDESESTNTLVKVLEFKDNIIVGLYKQYSIDESGRLESLIGIKNYSEEEIKGMLLYKPYTVNNDTIRYSTSEVSTKVTEAMNLDLKGELLLKYLAKKFNTTIDFIDDSNQDFFAKVNNGIIIINLAQKAEYDKDNKLTLGQYITLLAAHEFTHLMLANLRATNLLAYYELSKAVLDYVGKFTGMNNEKYNTSFQLSDEYIVRFIEAYLRNSISSSDISISTGNIETLINRGFKELFGKVQDKVNLSNTIISNLLNGFFKETTTYADIAMIRNQYLLDKILEDIIRKCE